MDDIYYHLHAIDYTYFLSDSAESLCLFVRFIFSQDGKMSVWVVRHMRPSIPNVTAEELAEKVRTILNDPNIETTIVNPAYSSWSMRVKKGQLDMEFVWGPLSGFGGRDLARPSTSEDTPFDYADEMFLSIDEALGFLRELAFKYA